MKSSSSSDDWAEEMDCFRRKNRKYWVRSINLERQFYGEYNLLMTLLEIDENSNRFHHVF